MARVTVEDCLDQVEGNPFALVKIAAARVRQLLKGAKPTVANVKNKAPVVALREIAACNVYFEGSVTDVLRATIEKSKSA